MRALILLSGGLDSSACIKYYLDLSYEVECLFCDYGQPASKHELGAAQAISLFYNVPLNIIRTYSIAIPSSGEICGRNALLVVQAFCYKGFGAYKIVLGIHSGTAYADCSEIFVSKMNRILDCYTGGTVILEAPFIEWEKREIVAYCKDNEIPCKMTYSCEAGENPPCGKCLSCLDRKEFLDE